MAIRTANARWDGNFVDGTGVMRTGKGGRRFKMYKFRSMVPNAEELKLK